MITLDTPLANLPSIKKPMLARLHRLGIVSANDLLCHFPSRYEDFSETLPIAEAAPGIKATFEGTILSLETKRTWKKKMIITEAVLEDNSGTIRLLWFNQKYISGIKEGERVRVSGKVSQDRNGLTITGGLCEPIHRSANHTGRLVPVYPETHGLTSRFLRWQIDMLLKGGVNVPDPIPQNILDRLHLPALLQAFKGIHHPRSENDSILAKKRFAFNEMFLIQVKALQIKFHHDKERAVSLPFHEDKIKSFINRLPFQLTDAQKKASWQILQDLEKTIPMNRLLNGDVGSGKTIVAALASLQTALSGYQVAILAPTEVLARQHFESLSHLFSNQPFETALLTQAYHILGNETVSRQTLLQAVQSGIARIIVATHAILQKTIRFHNLALVIVDEQHRFGVAQRAHLQQKAMEINDGLPDVIPHFLTMTATPIPRTLALTFFGNLDLSLLDEMPKNRKPIITKVAANEADRQAIYRFIRKEVEKKHQIFIILPLVEESKALTEIKAATEEYKRLSEEVFPHFRIGLLHGRMPAKTKSISDDKPSKEKVMEDFKAGKYDILVATSVVEVGIDIPNATVILIEDADRFGLAQLHQFRGRVGRGKYQSYCFLLPGTNASATNERLEAMVRYSNGFELAEIDMKLRGPGTLFGTSQSGIPDIAMENIANTRLIEIAQKEALALLQSDPMLTKHPLLQKALEQFEEKIHLE